jgi:DNA processing protein
LGRGHKEGLGYHGPGGAVAGKPGTYGDGMKGLVRPPSVETDRLLALLRLLLVPGMDGAAAARLLRAFGDDPDRVLATDRDALALVRGVGPALAAAVAAGAPPREAAVREAARAAELGIVLVVPGDAAYPAPLRSTYDPPPLLYAAGEWMPEDLLSVSIVGSRRATPYGLVTAARLARGLAERGVAVVSGLARGIDTAAHEATLAAGGRTLAVMGSGHARPYPSENIGLLRAIARSGAVFSEFPLDAPPLPHHFPRRNRVLAALSLGTLVVEADEKSGSLITAGLALEMGREVMAVPGRVDAPLSKGVHRLLRDGAALVEGPDDIFHALGLDAPPPGAWKGGEGLPVPPGGPEDRVLAALADGEVRDADAIARASGLAAAEVRAALGALEVEGAVRAFPGGRFAKA